MDDYISLLKQSVKAGKTEQAENLLENLSQRLSTEKEAVLQILALAPDKIAFKLLDFLNCKKDLGQEFRSRLNQLIIDRAHLNYNFILILLDTESPRAVILDIIPILRHILTNETDNSLLNKIIRAAGKLGIEKMADDIAEFIFYDDPLLKAEAVKALERIGTSRACEKLVQVSKTKKCDQNILDAIEFLTAGKPDGHNGPVEGDRSGISSETDFKQLADPLLEKRFKAFMDFSDSGALINKALEENLAAPDHDLMINLLRIISRSIPAESVKQLLFIIKQKELDNRIKYAAYNALESFPELKSAASIIGGISEQAMFVRLAAIRVLDKNLSDFICAEIRKKIESGTKKGETLAQTILDARAKNLTEHLMISDTFSYMASNHLAKAAPIPVLDTFTDILEKRKLRSTVKKYKNLRKEKKALAKEDVIIISPWKSTLNIYSRLVYSCGFSSLMFQSSQDAFESIVAGRPRAVICDIFLNDMTGIDLTAEVRELYPADQVPVILSSLQKGLDKEWLQKEMDRVGVSAMCSFPPKTSQVKSWFK